MPWSKPHAPDFFKRSLRDNCNAVVWNRAVVEKRIASDWWWTYLQIVQNFAEDRKLPFGAEEEHEILGNERVRFVSFLARHFLRLSERKSSC